MLFWLLVTFDQFRCHYWIKKKQFTPNFWTVVYHSFQTHTTQIGSKKVFTIVTKKIILNSNNISQYYRFFWSNKYNLGERFLKSSFGEQFLK